MEQKKITVEEAGARLDSFLSEKDIGISRSYAQRLIKDELVLVNDKVVKSNYKVKLGDIVTVAIPEPEELSAEPEDIKIDIVYEDEQIIIVDKPKGMVVHPAPGNASGTLVNALLYHCRGRLSNINGVIRPGIVHRIDKDTSGLLLVTKTNEAHEYFSELFKKHEITRVYYAVVHGSIKEDKAVIDAPLGRHPVDRMKRAVDAKNGVRAVTHFKVLERFSNHTLIECRLETGRTHQIRAHMAYIKFPLVGDPLYGRRNDKLLEDGQALHAGVLGFVHPVTKEYMEFRSEPPKSFTRLIEKLREMCYN